MKRDRISDGVYVFTSGMYAEVTATVVFTDEGAIVVDTLPFPRKPVTSGTSLRSGR